MFFILSKIIIAIGLILGMILRPEQMALCVVMIWIGAVISDIILGKISWIYGRRNKRVYIGNYPMASLGRLAFDIVLGLGFLGVFFVLSGLGVQTNIERLHDKGFSWIPILLIIFCSPFLLYPAFVMAVCVMHFLQDVMQGRLPIALKAYTGDMCMSVPDCRDPRNHYGYALARQCRILDRMAEEKKATPLYDLGILQECEKKQVWFPDLQGVETIDALLESCSGSDSPLDEETRKELEMIRAVIQGSNRFHIMLV